MIKELKHISTIQTGKIFAIIYTFIGIIMVPFMIKLAVTSQSFIALILLIIMYPIIGFIAGVLLASIYNIASKLVGGIRFTVEDYNK